MAVARDTTARPDPSDRRRARLLGGAAVLACLAGAALAIDLPVAEWCKTTRLPRELLRLLNFAEVFAHGTGVAALLIAALVLDPSVRWPAAVAGARSGAFGGLLARLAAPDFIVMTAATFTGGLIVDLIKASVGRVRPRAAELANLASVFGTFDIETLAPAGRSGSDLTSFPSGHAAVAAGLAAALTWKYPHGGRLFAAFAALAAAQRVVTSAHYPSDVCCGAAIGLLGAALFLRRSPRPPGGLDSPGDA